MNVRHASCDDLDVLEEIYEEAKRRMHEGGNPNQWHQGHPNREDLIGDLAENSLFVLEDEEGIQACFKFAPGPDPTYLYIEGSWLNDAAYMVIHRVVSAGRRPGMGSAILSLCKSWYPNLKIDTHQDNLPMQRVLEKNGFILTGIIYLENGDPRLAYQFAQD